MKRKVICLIFLFICSCKDIPVTPKESRTNYFPLKVGNEWTFEFPYWTPWSGDTLVNVSYKINNTKQVNGKEYFAFNYRMPFFPDKWIIESIDTIFVRQNEKGDMLFLVDKTEWLYFSFDASLLGSLIKTKIKNADYYYQIESVNDTVNSPIGSFNNCYKILNYFPEITGTEHYIWFAPGYCPVKIYYPELGVTYQLIKVTIQ